MEELSTEDRAELDRVLRALNAYTELLQHGEGLAAQSQRHDDAMAVWIVGLCAGAVAVLGPVLGAFGDVTIMPRFQLVMLYGIFVIGLLFGIGHRYTLAKLMEADQISAMARRSALVAVTFRRINSRGEIDRMREEILAIFDGKDEKIKPFAKKVNWWACCVNRIQYIPMIIFGLGVVALVVFILLHNLTLWQSC